MNQTPLFDVHARTLSLLGELTSTSIDQCLDYLLRFHNDRHRKRKPITLYVSSSGGSIPQFTRLYDILQILEAPVITIGLGQISGIGGLLLACGSSGKRWVLSHVLISTYGVMEAVEQLPPNTITLGPSPTTPRENGRTIMQSQLLGILAQELSLARDFVEALQNGGAMYTAVEAVKFGLADQIYSNATNQQ